MAYNLEEKNLMRLICIHKKVTTKVLHFVFKSGSSDRSPNVSLLDYYKDKGSTKFQNGLYTDQKKKIENDPTGLSYDITLLYKCLRDGSHGLEKSNHENWKKDDKASIESLLSIVKNKRNHIAHDLPTFTNKEMRKEAQEIQDILEGILKLSCKLYGLPSTAVDTEIADVQLDIQKYLNDEFEPKTFEEYKEELIFETLSEYANDAGAKEVLLQYDKSNENEISTVNHLADVSVPLGDAYTDMRLKVESLTGTERSIGYDAILQDERKNETSATVVINGVAGVGKTTLTKKILLDWKMKQSSMKFLNTYDHVLKVECRNVAIKSFDDILHHLMPKVSKEFKSQDLRRVMLAQKVLLILDGLDELNESSAILFEEVLDLKSSFGIMLLLTTRPEKLEYIEQKLKSHRIEMKHIQLQGIPPEKREELVIKYYSEISKKYSCTQDISGLLHYLKKTEHRLADLWKLPYNLTLLIILWTFNHMNIVCISTAPELYREILLLYRTKLKERLQSHKSMRHLDESVLYRRIDFFMYHLAKESLKSLKDNSINLLQEACERLQEICNCAKIPFDEMISAFLKRVPSTDIIYSYPHKGLQDYLSAHFIWLEITGGSHKCDAQSIMEEFTAVLLQHNVNPKVSNNILKSVKRELKGKATTKKGSLDAVAYKIRHFFPRHKGSSVIHSLFQDVHGDSKFDISKFQNMLVCLIGMFYSENTSVDDEIKLETLELLQGTGVKDQDAWIAILSSVKCDKYIASFISRQERILQGNIQITDSTVSAYASLMEALTPPVKNASKVSFNIHIMEELREGHRLLQLISLHQLTVKKILINDHNYKEYTEIFSSMSSPLKDESEIEINIHVSEDLRNVKPLLEVVRKKCFVVKKLDAKPCYIHDSNFSEYLSLLYSMPRLIRNANLVSVDIEIKGDLTGTENLISSLIIHQFTIRRLLLNESNLRRYVVIFKNMDLSCKQVEQMKVDMVFNINLLHTKDLIEVVSKLHIQVKHFKVPDFVVTDLNYKDYALALRQLKQFGEFENRTNVDIAVKGDVADARDLLYLLCCHQFQVKKFLITENNYMTYTSMLTSLKIPFKEARNVEVELQIDEDITSISRLFAEVQKKRFGITEFKIRGMQVNDSNVTKCLLIFRALSPRCKVGNSPGIDVAVEKSLDRIDSLFYHLSALQLNVNSILVTEENTQKYTEMLKKLDAPLKEARNINIDIKTNKELLEIQDLLKQVEDKEFQIRTLELGGRDCKINDDNLDDFTSTLKSLGRLVRGAYTGTFHIRIEREVPDISTLIQEVIRNGFAVDLRLHHDIRNLSAPVGVSWSFLSSLFQECPIEKYAGRITEDVTLPLSIKRLWGVVPNDNSYQHLCRFLNSEHQLKAISICVPLTLNLMLLTPLPGDLIIPPDIYIPDVHTFHDVQKAFEIVKRLTPTTGKKILENVFFPRLRLEDDGAVEAFQAQILDSRAENGFVLPSSAPQILRDRLDEVQGSDGYEWLRIFWRYPEGASASGLHDVDSWEE